MKVEYSSTLPGASLFFFIADAHTIYLKTIDHKRPYRINTLFEVGL